LFRVWLSEGQIHRAEGRIRPNGATDEIKRLPELEEAKGITGDS
jgi:hypothetical protein